MANKVKMRALWSFSGPEGAHDGNRVGRVRASTEFEATEERARRLMRLGKAERVAVPGPQVARQREPEETKAEPEPQIDLHSASVREILEQVDRGLLSSQAAMEAEEERESPRSTLVEALRQREKAGG